MHSGNSETPVATQSKRPYSGPAIIDVGSIETLTTGSSSPVGDPPADGTTGYYNSAPTLQNAEVELGGR